MRFAGAVFFLGYSLYDLDIKRILFDDPFLKDKCFFFLGKSPKYTAVQRTRRFGRLFTNSVEEFCFMVNKKSTTYIPKIKHFSTLSIKEHTITHSGQKITDRDFSNLLLFGLRNQNMMFESMKVKQKYLLERRDCGQVFKLIEEGSRIITICSDMGNGKSLFLDGIRIKALERGFRVFEVTEHNEEAASELEAIAKLKEKLLITIEEYQDWISEIRQFILNSNKEAILILTARSATHEVVIDNLIQETQLNSIPEIYIDLLDDSEIDWFIDVLNEYGLWGEWAARTRSDKFRLIKTNCRGQIHALLLKIIDSPDIGQRLHKMADSLNANKSRYEILLGICIMTLLN